MHKLEEALEEEGPKGDGAGLLAPWGEAWGVDQPGEGMFLETPNSSPTTYKWEWRRRSQDTHSGEWQEGNNEHKPKQERRNISLRVVRQWSWWPREAE